MSTSFTIDELRFSPPEKLPDLTEAQKKELSTLPEGLNFTLPTVPILISGSLNKRGHSEVVNLKLKANNGKIKFCEFENGRRVQGTSYQEVTYFQVWKPSVLEEVSKYSNGLSSYKEHSGTTTFSFIKTDENNISTTGVWGRGMQHYETHDGNQAGSKKFYSDYVFAEQCMERVPRDWKGCEKVFKYASGPVLYVELVFDGLIFSILLTTPVNGNIGYYPDQTWAYDIDTLFAEFRSFAQGYMYLTYKLGAEQSDYACRNLKINDKHEISTYDYDMMLKSTDEMYETYDEEDIKSAHDDVVEFDKIEVSDTDMAKMEQQFKIDMANPRGAKGIVAPYYGVKAFFDGASNFTERNYLGSGHYLKPTSISRMASYTFPFMCLLFVRGKGYSRIADPIVIWEKLSMNYLAIVSDVLQSYHAKKKDIRYKIVLMCLYLIQCTMGFGIPRSLENSNYSQKVYKLMNILNTIAPLELKKFNDTRIKLKNNIDGIPIFFSMFLQLFNVDQNESLTEEMESLHSNHETRIKLNPDWYDKQNENIVHQILNYPDTEHSRAMGAWNPGLIYPGIPKVSMLGHDM